MKRILSIAALTAISIGLTVPAFAQNMTLRSVTLFTSGVAEFAATGRPAADGTLSLDIANQQMDDVVRSITVVSSDGSPVRGISFPGGEELSRRLARFQIDLTQVHDLLSLLDQVRGATVTVTTNRNPPVTGQVIGVSRASGARDTESDELVLVSDSTIRRITVDQIGTLAFDDPDLQRELESALEVAGASDGPESPRTLTIQLPPGTEGQVTVRYLREMPLWDTSYRAVIDGESVLLQGWAHVHNVTAGDWDGVSLSIVSARPVTYYSDLYTPRWVSRSSAPAAASRPSPAPRAMRESAAPSQAFALDDLGSISESVVEVNARTESLSAGIAFSFPDPVSLPAGNSAMIPIVQETFDAEQVRSYDPRRDGANPRISIGFRNSSTTELPGGIVTVYDGPRYAGDAILPTVFVGGTVTLPYAVDIAHTITADIDTQPEELRSVRIVDGSLMEEHRQRRTRRYRVERNGEDRPQPIEMTIGIPSGWDVVSPSPIERSGQDLTFRTSGSTLTVVEERIRRQQIALTSANPQTLVSYSSNRLIDPVVRRTLQNVVELRRQLEEAQERRRGIDREISEIQSDQSRIAQNMANLDRDSSLYRRYVRELDTQEDRLALLQRDRSEALEAEEEAQSALSEYIRTLN